MEGNQLKFSALLSAVIRSAPFQQRRGEGNPAELSSAK